MTRRRRCTLPEIDIKDSNNLEIISVDKEANTVHMKMGEHKITVVCRQNSNPEVFEWLQEAMIEIAVG